MSGPATGATQPTAPSKKSGKRVLIPAAVVFVLLIAALFIGWRIITPRQQPFSSVNLRQITDSGDISLLTMSSDGRTLALVKKVRNQQSLWLRNVPTNAETQILPPSTADYAGIAFSKDGDNLYFSRSSEDNLQVYSLYSVAVFGGPVRSLIHDVDSAPSFSPDGERFVYLRRTPESKDHTVEMHVIRRDLTGDEIIYKGDYSASTPAWSPDGNKIAWSEIQHGRNNRLQVYDVNARQAHPLFPEPGFSFHRFFVWMPDSSHAVTTYYTKRSDLAQLGFLDFSSGHIVPITNDLAFYSAIAISADGKTLATISRTPDPELSVYGNNGGAAISTSKLPISPTALAWQNASHIAFVGRLRLDSYDITDQTVAQINLGEVTAGNSVSVCSDGRLIFAGIAKGASAPDLFRMNADGSDLAQITSNGGAAGPQCLSGGNVHYTEQQHNDVTGWSVPANGGSAQKLFSTRGPGGIIFSNDGSFAVAGPYGDPHKGSVYGEIHALNHPETAMKNIYLNPRQSASTWHISPNGKELVYPIVEQGQWSLLSQSIDTGSTRMLTEASPLDIEDFDWSPDGSRFAVLRKRYVANAVLITDQPTGTSR